MLATLLKPCSTSQVRCLYANGCIPMQTISSASSFPARCLKSSRLRPPPRHASSASSSRWRTRQSGDAFSRDAKIAGLKSRAAFKLLQINDKYHIFKRGMTVVDLGYAPGSWSQVAVNRCAPDGRVIGVDILPSQPPQGVSTIQGDFLSPAIQAEVRHLVSDPNKGRPKPQRSIAEQLEDVSLESKDERLTEERSYIGVDHLTANVTASEQHGARDVTSGTVPVDGFSPRQDIGRQIQAQWTVDVVLSDMLMSTSGMAFRDHAGSMDLCTAALLFAFDTIKEGGHFVCKFYQGGEDKLLEKRIRRLFDKVHRDKPAASRSESKEGYFVALRRRSAPTREDVFAS